jgi:hypothetical protein
MKYGNILRLAGKKKNAPTLEPVTWSIGEKERIEKGLCVTCGDLNAGKNSYLCSSCESSQTSSDIEAEITALRKIGRAHV